MTFSQCPYSGLPVALSGLGSWCLPGMEGGWEAHSCSPSILRCSVPLVESGERKLSHGLSGCRPWKMLQRGFSPALLIWSSWVSMKGNTFLWEPQSGDSTHLWVLRALLLWRYLKNTEHEGCPAAYNTQRNLPRERRKKLAVNKPSILAGAIFPRQEQTVRKNLSFSFHVAFHCSPDRMLFFPAFSLAGSSPSQ